jgi:chromosome segregation protein
MEAPPRITIRKGSYSLLKLKRVEIQGFKSFYDRTEMKFPGSGIAAVVGPNGCGKSNLSDAISWVLGEQSAKSLRGARMEDVIFAGTRDKKALGMASVTMTLVPDEAALAAARVPTPESADNPVADTSVAEHIIGDAPQEASDSVVSNETVTAAEAKPIATAKPAQPRGEITITRRLYRSGESEYLINGKQARLRDIQDLFLGTGLGPESYAIIEQGRIGQILSNRPQDRRAVIEEAAGITKFKTRKRLAEAKLESAKQNLARVFDILEEVTRQANSLKRQASKTKRYGELKSEATAYLRELLTVKFRSLEREMAGIAIELNLASAELEKAQAEIAEREGSQEKVLAASYDNERELTEARKQLAELKLESERVRGKLEYQTKQIERTASALETGQRDWESLGVQQAERSTELDAQQAELVQLEQVLAQAQTELNAKSAERQQAQNSLNEQERSQEGKRQELMRLYNEAGGLKNRITQLEGQLTGFERDANRARADESQSAADQARIQQAKQQLSEQLAQRQTALISVEEQRKTIETELQQARTAVQQGRGAVERLQAEASRVRARKDSLEEVIQHRSYTTETVKRLFTAVERGKAENFQPVGVLADFLEVDPQLEKATEEFLHDELEYVVVRNWTEGERGVELMRGDLNGRGTFLVEDPGRDASSAETPQPPAESGMTKLSDALRWTNGLSQLPIAQLPRIANCYVSGDRSLVRELATQFPHCWFLTPDGVNYHGQSVSGGKKTGAGPLALKRELREVQKLAAAKQSELDAARAALVKGETKAATLGSELDRLRGQQQAQEKEVLALDHESRKLAEELNRVQGRLSHARIELERVGRERVKVEETVAQDREKLSERERVRAESEAALEAAREELSGLRNLLARLTEEHSAKRAELAGIEERRRALTNSRARLETQIRDLANRRAHIQAEHERMHAERGQLEASNAELSAKSTELATAIGRAAEVVEKLAAQEAEFRAQLAITDEDLKRLRSAAQAEQEKRSERQVALARAESELKHLEQTCAEELATTLTQLAEAAGDTEFATTLEELEANYAEVRRKIEALGPVNPTALEEFEEAQERQEFLSAQRQDLIDSIRDTERAIQEIDNESRKRFGEAFHAINANFRKMFEVLFGGGTGEMRLTDEENLAESGIDIVASPPGKRLQSVLLLSGGEKSLTAMALLMSIFQYTPSPFCILDEVDAPLDEPNIERLTRLLQNMSEETQFIVITHAKRTMEAAQSLYGVTMQEPGVSKLVSVRFKAPAEKSPTQELVAATA